MPSSNRRCRRASWLGFLAVAAPANAQQQAPSAQGFASERFYSSAPGGGWLVMDTLDMRGGFGGAVAISSGYAHNPVVVSDGSQRLALVADQAFVTIAMAATYDRFRLYLDLTSPVSAVGSSGTVGGYQLTAPSSGFGPSPDTISDVRLGFDARLLGEPDGAFRLGIGAQLFVNSGDRADFVTDNTYRAMGRLLFAGDVGQMTYAGHVGVHVRPLDDSPAPGSPHGSELLYGIALGPRLAISDSGDTALIVGPEVYGETAFRSFFGRDETGVEGLLSARVEGTKDDGLQLRFKVGAGPGLATHFGAPEWRMVVGFELFDHNMGRHGGRF
jgi:hypothetical protein